MTNNLKSGALIDIRPESERIKDYKFEEIVASANPVNWVEKTQAEWRKFPIANQGSSGSCVSKTLVKLLSILYWLKNGIFLKFSSTHVYQRRANRPDLGMWAVDAFNIAREGVTLEELVPSQDMSDAQMDSTIIPQYKQDVGKVFRVPNYVALPIRDIDTVASVIQTTGKGVMVWFYFRPGEWTNEPRIIDPNLNIFAPATLRHSVTAVDWTMYKGQKAIIIEDSWGTKAGINGQRVITESFFRARNYYAGYPIAFVFHEQNISEPKPRHTFTKVLAFGMRDDDVRALQDALKYFGYFPTNVTSTGLYGAITASGLFKWQKDYSVASIAELNALQGRRFGQRSIAKMNELLS